MESIESTFKTWLIIFALLAIIIGKGLFSFFWIGDSGMPSWNYGTVPDVPGESPYAVYRLLPHSQHIRGEKGE